MAQLDGWKSSDQTKGMRPNNWNVKWKGQYYQLKRRPAAKTKIIFAAVNAATAGTKATTLGTGTPDTVMKTLIPPVNELWLLMFGVEGYIGAAGPPVSPRNLDSKNAVAVQSCWCNFWKKVTNQLLATDNALPAADGGTPNAQATVDVYDCPFDDPSKALEMWVDKNDGFAIRCDGPTAATFAITQALRVTVGRYKLVPLDSQPSNCEDLDQEELDK